jgi:hypothetical protein
MIVFLLVLQDFLKPPDGVKAEVADKAPKIDFALFENLPKGGKGTLWSSWGDGLVASNGKYYTAIGDHGGYDATSHVYEYDPVTKKLRLIVDVAKAIGQKPGDYGHGKIHAAIHEYEGALYFATYWGKPREIDAAYGKGYQGSIVLRFDLKTEQVENLGAIVPKQGLPASHFDPSRALLYFHAVREGNVAVYDLKERKVKFLGGAGDTEGARTFMRDLKGRVYFTVQGDALSYYDPDANKIVETKAVLPQSAGARKGDSLRAAARCTKDGMLYGMTAAGKLFSFDTTTETIKDLGPNFGEGDYTAVMTMSADEKYLYYAPGAHGSAVRTGTPVVRYEIATGKRVVLAFLNAAFKELYQYNIGGTYNVQIDAAGEKLFFTFNGGEPGDKSPFGKPCVVVVHLR